MPKFVINPNKSKPVKIYSENELIELPALVSEMIRYYLLRRRPDYVTYMRRIEKDIKYTKRAMKLGTIGNVLLLLFSVGAIITGSVMQYKYNNECKETLGRISNYIMTYNVHDRRISAWYKNVTLLKITYEYNVSSIYPSLLEGNKNRYFYPEDEDENRYFLSQYQKLYPVNQTVTILYWEYDPLISTIYGFQSESEKEIWCPSEGINAGYAKVFLFLGIMGMILVCLFLMSYISYKIDDRFR